GTTPPCRILCEAPEREPKTAALIGARRSNCPKRLKIVKLVHVRHATHLPAPRGVRAGSRGRPAECRHGTLAGRRHYPSPPSRPRDGRSERVLESGSANRSRARAAGARGDRDGAERR